MDTQPQSYLTNYTKNSMTAASQVLQTVFVSDDEMQVMGSPAGSRNERVVTPVDREQPLDPIYMEPTPRRDDDLNVQPSRGPREAVNVTGDIIDNYLKKKFNRCSKSVRLRIEFQCIFATNKGQCYDSVSFRTTRYGTRMVCTGWHK